MYLRKMRQEGTLAVEARSEQESLEPTTSTYINRPVNQNSNNGITKRIQAHRKIDTWLESEVYKRQNSATRDIPTEHPQRLRIPPTPQDTPATLPNATCKSAKSRPIARPTLTTLSLLTLPTPQDTPANLPTATCKSEQLMLAPNQIHTNHQTPSFTTAETGNPIHVGGIASPPLDITTQPTQQNPVSLKALSLNLQKRK